MFKKAGCCRDENVEVDVRGNAGGQDTKWLNRRNSEEGGGVGESAIKGIGVVQSCEEKGRLRGNEQWKWTCRADVDKGDLSYGGSTNWRRISGTAWIVVVSNEPEPVEKTSKEMQFYIKMGNAKRGCYFGNLNNRHNNILFLHLLVTGI